MSSVVCVFQDLRVTDLNDLGPNTPTTRDNDTSAPLEVADFEHVLLGAVLLGGLQGTQLVLGKTSGSQVPLCRLPAGPLVATRRSTGETGRRIRGAREARNPHVVAVVCVPPKASLKSGKILQSQS